VPTANTDGNGGHANCLIPIGASVARPKTVRLDSVTPPTASTTTAASEVNWRERPETA